MSSIKTALVMRATGYQGKATISHLTKLGWNVHALIADAKSDRATALKAFGPQVSLHEGTWKDPSTIEAALKGCQALLLNQLPSFTDDAEVQEARIVLQLAKEAGVQHVVFTSSMVLNNPNAREDYKHLSAAPAVLNKGDVEKVVQASGMTWTLMRPGYFTTNLLPPLVHWMYPDTKEGRLVNSYGPDCVITLIDPDDIGAFVAAAFEEPKKFGEQIITLVGENIRFDDMMKQYSDACGYQFEVVYRTPEETEKELANPFVSGNVLCIGLEKFVNIDETTKWGIPLTSFKAFLKKHKHELPNGPLSAGGTVSVPFADSGMVGIKEVADNFR
jgi:uncharacterized protein YbjT (DUF2867 family)